MHSLSGITVSSDSGSPMHTISTKLPLNAALAPPVLSLVAAVNGQTSLKWTSVGKASSYNLYCSTTSGSGYAGIASNVTATSYMDGGLPNGANYYYVVTSVSASNFESRHSNQVTATPTSQAFGFLNVGNGSVLTRQNAIDVSMRSRNYGSEGHQVAFLVDGQDVDDGGDYQTPVNGGANASTLFSLSTKGWPNGSHILKVQDSSGNSSSVRVVFKNSVSDINVTSMFDPSGNGLPKTATIAATLGATAPWTVCIVTIDNAAKLIRSWNGKGSKISLAWDGTGTRGVSVPDDAYEVDITTTANAPRAGKGHSSAHRATYATYREIVNKSTS